MRQTAFLAILLAAALAGCIGAEDAANPAAAEEDGETAAESLLDFGPAEALPGNPITAEPNVITGPDGKMWTVAPGSAIGEPNVHDAEVHLWRSEDGGASWETLRIANHDADGYFCSCDADIALGPEGTLYLTDFWISPAANGFVVQASEDGGESFGPGNFVTTTNPVANDRQYVTAGTEAGVVYLSYARGTLTPSGAPDAGLHLWRSDDGGRTFTQRTHVAGASDGFPLIAKPRVGPDGTVYFPWYEVTDGDPTQGTSTVKLGVSTDGGQTFEVREVAQSDGYGIWPLQADVGPDGTVHLAWMDRMDGGGSQLKYTHTSGQAGSFAPVRTVGWANGTAVLPWVAAAGSGRAAVGFYGTPKPVVPTEAPNGTRWDAWALTVEAGGDASEPVRVSPFPVKVGPMCPNGAGCEGDRELLDYPAVAWDDGRLTMVFAVSTLDEGAGPDGEASTAAAPLSPPATGPEGGHDANAHLYVTRAKLPAPGEASGGAR